MESLLGELDKLNNLTIENNREFNEKKFQVCMGRSLKGLKLSETLKLNCRKMEHLISTLKRPAKRLGKQGSNLNWYCPVPGVWPIGHPSKHHISGHLLLLEDFYLKLLLPCPLCVHLDILANIAVPTCAPFKDARIATQASSSSIMRHSSSAVSLPTEEFSGLPPGKQESRHWLKSWTAKPCSLTH